MDPFRGDERGDNGGGFYTPASRGSSYDPSTQPILLYIYHLLSLSTSILSSYSFKDSTEEDQALTERSHSDNHATITTTALLKRNESSQDIHSGFQD